MLDNWISEIVGTFVVLVAGVITWFVRTVMTNARRIELLENEIAERDKRRTEDREMMVDMRKEIREELKELRTEMHRLYQMKS